MFGPLITLLIPMPLWWCERPTIKYQHPPVHREPSHIMQCQALMNGIGGEAEGDEQSCSLGLWGTSWEDYKSRASDCLNCQRRGVQGVREDVLPCWPVLLFQTRKELLGKQAIPVLSKGQLWGPAQYHSWCMRCWRDSSSVGSHCRSEVSVSYLFSIVVFYAKIFHSLQGELN